MKNAKMTSIGRRALALLLSILMVVTLMPTAVFANNDPDPDEEYVQEGVYNWPYDDSEIYHTVYYYANGVEVPENKYSLCLK